MEARLCWDSQTLNKEDGAELPFTPDFLVCVTVDRVLSSTDFMGMTDLIGIRGSVIHQDVILVLSGAV